MVSGGRADVRGAGGGLTGRPGDGVFVVFNPASGRGGGAKRRARWLELLEAELPGFRHASTEGPGDEANVAERAVEDGAHTVVAVGGDGTWSHVADRLVALGRGTRLGLLPSGTGNDFARNLGISGADPRSAVRALAEGRTRRVDVGRVGSACFPERAGAARGGEGPGEARAGRHFLNVVGFGFDVAVIDAAAGARFLRGELLYKWTAVQQLFRYGGIRAGVDGATPERLLMLTVSNGRWFGGGIPIAPAATVDDGRLHACRVGDAPPLTRAALFSKAGRGRHVDSHRVSVRDAGRFTLTFESPPRFEIDGDVFRAADGEVELEALPGALEVLAP